MPRASIHYIEELSARWEPELKTAFLAAVQDIRSRVSISALAKLLERGDVDGALRLLNLDPADFSQLALDQARAFSEGGMATASRIPVLKSPEGFRLQIRFDVRNLAAERWIREHSSTLIQEIVSDQRDAVRAALQAGLARGLNPTTTALDLVGRVSRTSNERQGGIIGLHSTQEETLERYATDLASDDPAALRALLERRLRDRRFDRSVLKAIREGTALPADIQIKMRLQYANALLKFRADSIGRTETMAALNEAQHQAYLQGVGKGLIREQDVRRYVVTAGDDRVRPDHRLLPELNREGRGLNEPFQTVNGPVMNPPFGIMCRCRVRTDVDFLARSVERLRARAA